MNYNKLFSQEAVNNCFGKLKYILKKNNDVGNKENIGSRIKVYTFFKIIRIYTLIIRGWKNRLPISFKIIKLCTHRTHFIRYIRESLRKKIIFKAGELI